MEGRKGRTAVFLLLLACWLLVLSNNGMAQTWQKVVPSGGSCSGSSKPTYLGVTSGSYDGLGIGGFTGADAKCVAQFGVGARWMKVKDTLAISNGINYAANGWIDIRESHTFLNVSYIEITSYGVSSYSYDNHNCTTFTSNQYGNYYIFLKANGTIGYSGCDLSKPIHCVRD